MNGLAVLFLLSLLGFGKHSPTVVTSSQFLATPEVDFEMVLERYDQESEWYLIRSPFFSLALTKHPFCSFMDKLLLDRLTGQLHPFCICRSG